MVIFSECMGSGSTNLARPIGTRFESLATMNYWLQKAMAMKLCTHQHYFKMIQNMKIFDDVIIFWWSHQTYWIVENSFKSYFFLILRLTEVISRDEVD